MACLRLGKAPFQLIAEVSTATLWHRCQSLPCFHHPYVLNYDRVEKLSYQALWLGHSTQSLNTAPLDCTNEATNRITSVEFNWAAAALKRMDWNAGYSLTAGANHML